MKLPRYTAPQTGTVGELQSLRNAQITPQEAANAQLVKYGAIAAGVAAVGVAVKTVSDVRTAAQDAQDDITWETGKSNLKAGFQNLDNDPNLKKAVQDDGTSTTEYYKREADALLKTHKEHLNGIVNPKTKQRAQGLAKNLDTEYRADVEGQLGVIESRIAGDALYTGFTEALRNGDLEGASTLIQTGKDRLLLDPENAEKWTVAVEKEQIKREAGGYVEDINNGFAISEEEGRARLSALIKDTSVDKEVRDLAVDQAEELSVEWGKARSKETEQQEVQAIINYGDDHLKASKGESTYEQVEAAFAGDKYGDHTTVGAAKRRNQLMAAVDAGTKAKESVLDVSSAIKNGQFIDNDKKNRDALSSYEVTATEGMDAAEQRQTIGDISRIAGTVSTQTSKTLNLSAVSQEAATQVLPLYRELISQEGLKPDLHLDGPAEIVLEDASVLVDAGLSEPEAMEIAWGNKDITESQRIDRSIAWKDSIIGVASDGYGELMGSDVYEEPGFGNIDDPPTLMAVEYSAVFKEVFSQTGNPVTAKNLADRATQRNWVMSNFNSANPKEYTVQKFGIPGDSRQIRASKIKELENDSFEYTLRDGKTKTVESGRYWVKKPDGTYKKASLDPEKITFETHNEKSDSFDAEGNQIFKVMHDGKPLTVITEDGIFVVEKMVERSKMDEFSKASNERDATEQRIKDIEKEEKRLAGLVENNIYATTTPKLTSRRTERITKLANEKKKLKSTKQHPVHF